jgi:hypothetical protein
VHLPGENPRFELVGHQHHHHFQCRQCQRVFDVHACPGDLGRLAPQGFTVEDHDLTLVRPMQGLRAAGARHATPRGRTRAQHRPAAPHRLTSPGATVLTAGAAVRLVLATLVIAVLWLAVAWALA